MRYSFFIVTLSVASHPSEDLIASAQTKAPDFVSSNQENTNSNCLSIHIRVWNHVRIETIRIIGDGILRQPVYKMAFLNIEVILL